MHQYFWILSKLQDYVWVQPKHVLANEYQTFLAELQLRDTRQLFGIAKARFQRAAVGNPSEKPFLSKSLQFVELAR